VNFSSPPTEPFPASGTLALVNPVAQHERDEQFRAAYTSLYPKIAAYVWTLTRDRETAHEIAQETFARLFDRWHKIQDPTAYGFRIATNLTRAAWRGTKTDRDRLTALGREALRDSSSPDATHAVDVRAVVDALPRRYRQLVLLHYYADLPLPDIATALDRPLGTVKRQLSEARQLMATALEGTR
jgi:RNA polymerase sigma-70 factor (ECF subfamily)